LNSTNPKKVDLVIGSYKDDDNKPFVLNSVRSAEKIIFESNMNHEYLPTEGLDTFNKAVIKLAYGE
jgi:aspartate aminotransferase